MYGENHTELTNTLRGQNAHYFTIRPDDMYINHKSLQGYSCMLLCSLNSGDIGSGSGLTARAETENKINGSKF